MPFSGHFNAEQVQQDHIVNRSATWPGHEKYHSTPPQTPADLCRNLTGKRGQDLASFSEMNYTRATHGKCNRKAVDYKGKV